MFCSSCGKSNDPGLTQCASCGRPLLVAPVAAEASSSAAGGGDAAAMGASEQAAQSSTATSVEPLRTVPYARFVLCFLISALLSCVAAFLIAYSLPFRQSRYLGIAIVCSAAAILVAYRCMRLWSEVVRLEPADDGIAATRQHRVLSSACIILLLLWAASSAVGWSIGASGAGMDELLASAHHERELGTAISQQRDNAERTISGQIEMYESIEPDVEEYQQSLNKLRANWLVYQQKFPRDNKKVEEAMSAIARELRRVDLLKQQIELAKKLAPLKSEHQVVIWRQQMIPLLEAEDELDKTTAQP